MNALSVVMKLNSWADQAEGRANAMHRTDPSEARELRNEISEARVLACRISIQMESVSQCQSRTIEAQSTLDSMVSAAAAMTDRSSIELDNLLASAKQFVQVD